MSKVNITPDQKAKLDLFVKAGGDSLLGIECFNNLNTNEEIPSGTVFYFKPDAIADPTFISDNLYQTLGISHIVEAPYNKELNEEHFKINRQNIENAVPQTVDTQFTIQDGIESGPWLSELGGSDSFVGVFYQMRDDHKTKDYYIAGRGTAPAVVQHLKSEISHFAPTYGQLVKEAEWTQRLANVKYMANRNLQRNLAQVAESCNVGIDRMLDFSSIIRHPDHGVGERAEPEHMQKLYTIENTTYKGEPAVALYNGVVSNVSGDKHFLVSNPATEGIYVFPITETKCVQNVSGTSTSGLSRTIKQEMKLAGWNPENHVGIMVPIVTKVYEEK